MRQCNLLNKCVILSVVVFLGLPAISSAQFYFGKNKVHYTNFEWQVMETEHFRIFFYDEERDIARMAARIAEDSYVILASKFKHEVYESIPLIIYSSPHFFTQTNVTRSLLPESVGGFTEFLKGRVVVPYNGSYKSFSHVIRHELVHVFTISKLRSVMRKQRSIRMAPPPLWFIEGIAEYWSTGWDSEADAIVKDMVLSGRLFSIPEMYRIRGTYFMYKLGQSICRFIDEHYGPDKLPLIFENWWKGRTFDKIVKITLGESLKDVSKKWEYDLKKQYFPEIADGGLAKREARQLTKSGYAVKGVPVILENGKNSGEWIVFKANRLGYSGLYMMPPDGEERKLYTLLKGERSAGFESLHLLHSGIDASDDGRVLFSSKSKETDVLYLFDINRKRVIHKYRFPELAGISSPRFSPDGNTAVISGARRSGFTDIYRVDLNDGSLIPLMMDIYNDIDPVFSVDGQSVIFASDRCLDGDNGAINLYEVLINSDSIRQLTYGNWRDITPDICENGIYFSSDRNGSFNVYRLNHNGTINQITNLLTGAYDPRVTSGGRELIFSGYQDFGFHIYRMDTHDSISAIAESPPSGTVSWRPASLGSEAVRSSLKYSTEYSSDIAQSAIAYDPVYGTMGGLQMALSDMLGDNIFYFILTNTAETKDDFITSFNFGVTYLNMKRRMNWGVGFFHFYDEYYNDCEGYYFERQAGGLVYFNYPLSKFNRFETSNYLRYSKKDDWPFLRVREALLLSDYVSFVSDNSLWDISGPIEGHRYNFTVGITSALDKGRLFNRVGLFDIRHYLRLGRYSAFASRLFGYSSAGDEPQRIYFGGSWSFRGYDRRQWYARNVVLASHELRFPLVDNLLVGFPIGGIGFQAIRGALFFDVGSAWDDDFDQLLGSFGAGFRVSLGQLVVLRFDFARTTDFEKISDRTDFDFFFGRNF